MFPSRFPSIRRLASVVLVVVALQACSMFDTKDKTEGWSASRLYTEGKDELRSGNYETAIDYFETLQARYPFGRYSQQAALEQAYANYKYDEPDAAIATLDRFIRTHPRHPYVDYAYYLKGLINFYRTTSLLDKLLPNDPTRTDNAASRQSFQDFQELVQRFPESRYTNDARQRMSFLRNNLAVYEAHVADYYMRRGAYVAAANRARYILETFAYAPATEQALAIMALAYLELDLPDLARDAGRVLQINYPQSVDLPEIENRLTAAGVGLDAASS